MNNTIPPSGTVDQPAPFSILPPPGLNFVAAVQISLNLLMIGTVWSAMLVPLLVVLFVFSTPQLRRKPVFILSTISILLGLVEGGLNIWQEREAMINPQRAVPGDAYIAFGILVTLIPMFTELVLLTRLLAIYPPSRSSWTRIAVIFGPIAAIKVLRVINLSIAINQQVSFFRQTKNPVLAGEKFQHIVGSKIEWIAQLVDNVYSSALFLWRLHEGRQLHSQVSSASGRTSYVSKLRALFWISVSNFVFPAFLRLAQIIFTFRDPVYDHTVYILMTNNYVEIIGVLLATIWASSNSWMESQASQSNPTVSVMSFRRKPRARFMQDHTFSTADITSTEGTTSARGDIIQLELTGQGEKEVDSIKRHNDIESV